MIYLLLLIPLNGFDDYQREEGVAFVQWSKAREVDYGFGPIVDDVESYVPDNKFSKAMRNRQDPGGWVHEQTHYVNSKFRGHMRLKTKREYNSFYVLGGWAVSLPEPAITLAQVATTVPKNEQGSEYKTYLVDAQNHPKGERNSQPMFVLDEASAAANALCYHINVGKSNKKRQDLASEWIDYSSALVRAVEKHDSKYSHMKELKAFVEWHNKRLRYLIKMHIQLTEPVKPLYHLY